MLRHCSSVRSIKACRPPPPMPALAKQPSTRPNRSRVPAIADFTDAALLTLQMRVSTFPEQPAMLSAAFLFFSALRPQIDTLQSAAASACAMPSPIPPLPPVMTATRPVRSKILMSVSNQVLRTSNRASAGADSLSQPWTSAPRKSNMLRDRELPAPRNARTRAIPDEETHAVQARHARYRRPRGHSETRSPGGDERRVHRHA